MDIVLVLIILSGLGALVVLSKQSKKDFGHYVHGGSISAMLGVVLLTVLGILLPNIAFLVLPVLSIGTIVLGTIQYRAVGSK